jgi:intracellular septation protein A
MLAVASRTKFDPNPVPFGLLFAMAFIWQVFTLCFHRRHLLTWILTILYAIPAVMLLIYVLRAVV